MSFVVPALGTGAVTAAGCVWYVPALVDLRAGADRPLSRRTGAAACLSGWGTGGVIAVLLLVADVLWVPAVAAVAGASVTLGLRLRAGAQRRQEGREIAQDWAMLPAVPRGHGHGSGASRYVFAVLVGSGLGGAVAAALYLMSAGSGRGAGRPAAVLVPAAVVGLFLTLALTLARAVRRRPRTESRPLAR
ncbi:hypothetical protein AB0M11_25740 [Streptomyces sp. NPDC051987]|uniref:hypothetical protein n=1 Tax=Streptomyces sp. NPDC051987 TaxID=3155808 RepID=UPI003433F752